MEFNVPGITKVEDVERLKSELEKNKDIVPKPMLPDLHAEIPQGNRVDVPITPVEPTVEANPTVKEDK